MTTFKLNEWIVQENSDKVLIFFVSFRGGDITGDWTQSV